MCCLVGLRRVPSTWWVSVKTTGHPQLREGQTPEAQRTTNAASGRGIVPHLSAEQRQRPSLGQWKHLGCHALSHTLCASAEKPPDV